MRVYLTETDTSEEGPLWAPLWFREYEQYDSLVSYIHKSAGEGGKPLAPTWEPVPVHVVRDEEKPQQLPAEIVTPGSNETLMFSQRAVEVLGDMLRADGELLPLLCDEEEYYLFNPLQIVDAIDRETSWIISMGIVVDFPIFGFQREKLMGLHIFKVPEKRLGHYFVSGTFKEAAEAAGLRNNLVFRLVWDSDDPDYLDERYAEPPGRWERVKQRFIASKEPGELPPSPPPPLVSVKTTEEPLSEDARENVTGMAHAAVAMLNDLQNAKLDTTDSPDRLVEAVSAGLEHLRAQGLEGEAREHRAIELGVLYGEQLVRVYGWRWAKIGDNHAVVAPDASLYLSPVGFIFRFLLEPNKDLTVMSLFKLLSSSQSGTRARGYQQVG